MSNGNVERCATLLITRSGTTEYHGDVLFFFFFSFSLFLLLLFNENKVSSARKERPVFRSAWWWIISGREFRERRGNIWRWSQRSAAAPGCAADTYICRDLIALPRFVYSPGAFVRYFVGVVVEHHRGVRCIDLDRVPRIVPGLRPWSRNGYTPLLHEIGPIAPSATPLDRS